MASAKRVTISVEMDFDLSTGDCLDIRTIKDGTREEIGKNLDVDVLKKMGIMHLFPQTMIFSTGSQKASSQKKCVLKYINYTWVLV